MVSDDPEWNREAFDPQRLLAARSRSWAILDEAFALLEPGLRSDEARARVDTLILERTGSRPWHPTQLRVDTETVLPFGARPDEPARIGAESLVFIDMGPLVEGYEGDVAATRRLGPAPDPLAVAAEEIHRELATRWRSRRATGRELYLRAAELAEARGFKLSLAGASGHRVADHPHEVRARLRALDRCPRTCAWVLEVHLVDESRRLGAFYEDLLC
jgi:Xaa-Pro aminopeptidase